ncbi:PmoA family protein [Pseudonocardia nigra]|uniref:DUF6807 domain-containing protein n=1 Tax=Pseudonocardia nigra TaxID=1921578 RepID=UPI0027E23026|nr:PmoA family protein [Pseudonocardia nigra]
MESPKPYFHPLRTHGGDVVSLYRPHDHVWHKGLMWSLANVSLPDVGSANFWGGPTYVRGRGYQWLPNDGTTQHRTFDRIDARPEGVVVGGRLDWITQQGDTWFTEKRSFQVTAQPDRGAWTLVFTTEFTNRTDSTVTLGSPTTEGRENAGYGGLFWRGPRSFSGGRAYTADAVGGDDLMGVREPWLAFAGRHDDTGRASTLVFVDDPANRGFPTTWFVRSGVYACVCPAPFFREEVPRAYHCRFGTRW